MSGGVLRFRKATKIKVGLVDGVRQRISLTSGKVIPMPKEATQRTEAATTVIGPKDTHPDDVCANSGHYL